MLRHLMEFWEPIDADPSPSRHLIGVRIVILDATCRISWAGRVTFLLAFLTLALYYHRYKTSAQFRNNAHTRIVLAAIRSFRRVFFAWTTFLIFAAQFADDGRDSSSSPGSPTKKLILVLLYPIAMWEALRACEEDALSKRGGEDKACYGTDERLQQLLSWRQPTLIVSVGGKAEQRSPWRAS